MEKKSDQFTGKLRHVPKLEQKIAVTAELIIFGVSLFIEVPKGSTEALEILLIQVNPVLDLHWSTSA
ncbi:hypothetical protein TYRP_011486 [Tyrophagus putrescentiae]|nr:hypothetical protein TYRP_011486 [Tyrophagus putrescentiae]